MSRRTAQNLLLILGGLLLTVAAAVFTLVSWGHLGIAGRGAILAVVTGVALAVPALLLRRGLNATAETVSVLALALMVLDGYAAFRVGLLPAVSGVDYAAGVVALVAAGAAGYGRLLPLRVAPIVSVVLAQAPLVMWFPDSAAEIGAAFTVTALLDVAIWLRSRRMGIRVTAALCLGVSAFAALLIAATDSVVGEMLWAPVGLLVVLTAAGLYLGTRVAPAVHGIPVAYAAIALTFALGSPVRMLLDNPWQALPYPLAAVAVMAVALRLPAGLRKAGVIAGAALAVLVALPFVPIVASGLFWPFRNVMQVWSGDPADPAVHGPVRPAVVLFAVLALVCWAAGRWWTSLATRIPAPATWRGAWGPGGLVLALVALLAAPAAFGLPYPVLVGVPLVPAVALSVLALRRPLAGWAAGTAAVEALAWGLGAQAATYVVLGVLFVTWAVWFRRPAALAGAALSGGGLVWSGFGGLGFTMADASALGCAAAAVLALLGAQAHPAQGDGRRFGRVAAIVLAGLAVLPVADLVVRGLLNVSPILDPWAGAPAPVASRWWALLALVVAGGVLVAATRPVALVVVAGVLAAVVPVAVRMPYEIGVGVLVLATVVAAVAGARARAGRWAVAADVAVGVAVWLGVLALAVAAATQTATLVTVPVLAAVAAAASLWGRAGVTGVVLATVLGAAEVAAVGAAHGLRTASLVAAGAGVVAVAAAAWKRNPGAGYVGTGFLLVASWLRLWAEEVTVVEAYTLPFSLVLLGIGWMRGRQVSSWKAYGAGLVFTFGPSLLAEPTALRSLLLGGAALLATVAGARFRLQAPAVLGALTLGVVAVRELAPWVAELVSGLPRWAPIAVGGLLLLVIGATYEARKRDLVRLKNAVAKLR